MASCLLRDGYAEVFVLGGASRILIIGFQPRLSHMVLLALLFRLAVDEPSIPLKGREGTISTQSEKYMLLFFPCSLACSRGN